MQDHQIKILCVEDEQDIRENICEILKDEGFLVFEAETAGQGYQQFLEQKPDIIISDILMPKVDGYQFLEMVRNSKNSKNNNVPFIFLSALGQKEDIIKGINLSANDHLVKPVDFDLMIAKIKEKIHTAKKINNLHSHNISSLKTQISSIIPQELLFHLDKIIKTSQSLKEEPYGPLPHRHYLNDFNQIYLDATVLKAIVSNVLDQQTLNNRLKEDEEIIDLLAFLQKNISELETNIKEKIHLNTVLNFSLPKIKIEHISFAETIKKIIIEIINAETECLLEINILLDQNKQLLIVFALKDLLHNLANNLSTNQILSDLKNQGCIFEIMQNKGNSAVLTIPEYRLL
jgi:CheY-like chemotaxis protein